MKTFRKISLLLILYIFIKQALIAQESYAIQNSNLRFELNINSKNFFIHDKKSNRIWESLPMNNISIEKVKNLSPEELLLDLYYSDVKLKFSATVKIVSDDRISFEVNIPDSDYNTAKEGMAAESLTLTDKHASKAKISAVAFPPSIKTNYNKGEIVLSIRSCGTLIAQTDTAFPMKNIMVYSNLGHDMPWVGVFDSKKGDGLMVLADTPFNAYIDLRIDGNILWPQIRWYQSMRKWSYPRKVTYIFSHSGGYVSLAKIYRSQLQKEGALNTFAQKINERPKVDWLRGAVLVWGSDGLRFAKEARAAGIKHAIIYGRSSASDINKMTEMGFITSEYENIMDCQEGPTGNMRDSKEKAAVHNSNGDPVQGWTDKDFVRSSVMSLAAVKKYMPELIQQSPFTGRFIDVGPATLGEDYHPEHTFGRKQDAEYKRGVAEYFAKEFGLVVGGEHGKSWSANVLDYSEGGTSGSFWWEDGNKPGYLIKPKDLSYMPKDFVAYGNNYRTRIPLWSLVYHDCLSTSWYWGDTNGWFYEVAPEISDQKDITDILYGTMPMCWADKKGYGWNRNRNRFLQTVRNICNFQEKIAFEEMISHEFLNDDRSLQRTYFKNGAMAVVNYGNKPQSYLNKGKEIVLAPYGFYATAPGFIQSKLIENNQVVTRIESKDFVSLETPVHRIKGDIETQGRITVFEVEPNKWHILAETKDEKSSVNIQKIAGLKLVKDCKLTELNDQGEVVKEISNNIPANSVLIPSSSKALRLFGVDIKR